ncbi:MAG: hypothetical protein RL215_555, partial [Planctomycetota bacterium]
MRCLGLDIGSSSIKGAVLDVSEDLVTEIVKVPFPEPIAGLPGGFHEVSAAGVLAGVREVLGELFRRCPTAERVR